MGYAHIRTADVAPSFTPVPTSALEAFLVELLKVMPHLRFSNRRNHEVHAYMDGCPYTLGVLGFDTSDKQYYILARDIKNNRFSEGSTNYYTLRSKDRKVAIRNAKKFLRPYTLTELASTSSGGAREALNEVYQKATTVANKHRSTATLSNLLLVELRHLIEMGHTFVDPDYGKAAQAWVAAQADMDTAVTREVHLTFVHVTNDWSGQVLRMLRMAPVKGSYIYNLLPAKDAVSEVVPVAEASETLMGRISVLSMLAPKSYVAGVGYRATEDIFYVET